MVLSTYEVFYFLPPITDKKIKTRLKPLLLSLIISFYSHRTPSWLVTHKRLAEKMVSARFEFRFESLKSISVLILFVYKLMIGSSKNNRENYPRKCF